MRNPTLRRVLRLTVTVLGLEPDVWRELIVDRDLTLGELHHALSVALEWSTDEHHVFTNVEPEIPPLQAQDDFLDDRRNVRDPWTGRFYTRSRWIAQRRWGDKWTMIDWRDPSVVEEASVRVGSVFDGEGDGDLFFASGGSVRWWCRVEASGDDIELTDLPRARLTAGSGRAPLPGGPDRGELAVARVAMADARHPDHVACVSTFERALGPWAPGAYDDIDVPGIAQDLALRFCPDRDRAQVRVAAGWPPEKTVLDTLVAGTPDSSRPGLRRHLARSRLLAPVHIDTPAAERIIRGFRWLLEVLGDAGVELVERSLPTDTTRCGADELQWSAERMTLLVASAKRLGLVRAIRGRLIGSKGALAVSSDPSALCRRIAHELLRRHLPGGSDRTNGLLMMAIADGSLDDPETGLLHVSLGLPALGSPGIGWVGGGHGSDHWSWCDGEDRPRWWRPYHQDVRAIDEVLLAQVLRDTSSLVDILTLVGLERVDEGVWSASPELRRFARAALL